MPHQQAGARARLAGSHRARQGDPARRPDAVVLLHRRGNAREHAEYPLSEVDLRPPVLTGPPCVVSWHSRSTLRILPASAGAEATARVGTSHRSSISQIRPRSTARRARAVDCGTEELDYELECAAMIGPARGLHRPQRLVDPERREMRGEREYFADVPRAGSWSRGRVRRKRGGDDRPVSTARSGGAATCARCTTGGRARRSRRAEHHLADRARSAPAPSGGWVAVLEHWPMVAGCSAATWSVDNRIGTF